ncbi:MAG: tol-pal system-associated acyl-CoA thioesterase [Bdellovibrionales bacterium]
MPPSHSIPVRVYYEDTDAGGIVYHASYLRFAERGRTEFLRALGWDHRRTAQELGALLIVRRVEIDYLAPALLDDSLEMRTEVADMGNASLTMTQTLTRGEQTLAVLKVVIVAISPEKRPIRMPPQLRQIFTESVSA